MDKRIHRGALPPKKNPGQKAEGAKTSSRPAKVLIEKLFNIT